MHPSSRYEGKSPNTVDNARHPGDSERAEKKAYEDRAEKKAYEDAASTETQRALDKHVHRASRDGGV